MEVELKDLGIGFARSQVGDRYVMELMKQKGWLYGGESSGHIICLDKTTTGDGIISALQVVDVMTRSGIALTDLRKGMKQYPQVMINVKADLSKQVWLDKSVLRSVADAEQKLGEAGRILLRPSGTEPLVRVMVEGENADLVNSLCRNIVGEVESAALKS